MNVLSEANSRRLLWVGAALFVLGIVLFIWKERFTTETEIDSSKIAEFGDAIGGIIGSIWSLAGVILFYIALTEQRTDIQINRKALEAQVEALNQQIEEFELQRKELEETRKVFQEQGITLRLQRFENTFFQLLSMHHELVDKLRISISRGIAGRVDIEKNELFTEAVKDLRKSIFSANSTKTRDSIGGFTSEYQAPRNKEIAKSRLEKAYKEFYFDKYKQIFSHYFRNTYHVFKFIFTSELIEENRKQFYATLARAQLSSDELTLIFYNSLIKGLGYPNFLFLIREFEILQNFDFNLVKQFDYHIEIYNDLKEKVRPDF
jgi:hypothetical protein